MKKEGRKEGGGAGLCSLLWYCCRLKEEALLYVRPAQIIAQDSSVDNDARRFSYMSHGNRGPAATAAPTAATAMAALRAQPLPL
jgi:hypothetical protein